MSDRENCKDHSGDGVVTGRREEIMEDLDGERRERKTVVHQQNSSGAVCLLHSCVELVNWT